MISSNIIVKTSTRQPMDKLIDAVEVAAHPTVGDLLYAGQRQRSRILDRTARGVDVDEQSFHPYSQNGPYYYYPSKNAKNRSAGAARMFKKIGKGTEASRTKLGIKFPSYAAFKDALGRLGVDLRGPSAPHMLQAILVRVAGTTLQVSDNSIDFHQDVPATEVTIGIYGDEAERAEAHNQGSGHIPRRHFLGASSSDKYAVLGDILTRASARVRKVLGQ